MGIIINEKHSKWPQKICSPSCIKTNPTRKKNQKDKLNMSKELKTNLREKLMVIDLAKKIPRLRKLVKFKRIVMLALEKDNMRDTLVAVKTLLTSTRRKEVLEKETGVQKTPKYQKKLKKPMLMPKMTNHKNK